LEICAAEFSNPWKNFGDDEMKLRMEGSPDARPLKTEHLHCDFAIVGGGLAGTCCAITAAREGLKVVLVQDRPVLGGNASSEVRLWALGATSHMGNNNRWAREGGVIDEILVENTFRNPEGNPHIFDTVLLEKVVSEPNITLLLNTAVFELTKHDPDTIASVRGFCSQNSTMYEIFAPLFCDASGDGIVGFLAGAAFRVGAESRDEFGEGFAPDKGYGELLGHTIYFYSKDVGRPVKFVPPSYALMDISKIPRFGQVAASDQGCAFWWLEYGGRHDTVHDTEKIKWELWSVVYGIWNHIKNSGKFPGAENLTLEWVGTIPGKRESRRFEGDCMLTQQDLIEQRRHDDAVSFGGWAIDLHPADGVFSELPACTQWHSKGVYQIPYRCLYSRNIANLFLAGRDISVSHVAFGSTRVMCTCANSAQAVAVAAALCRENNLLPRAVLPRIGELQKRLLRTGQHIPHVAMTDDLNLASTAVAEASGSLVLRELKSNGTALLLDSARAMLIPVAAGLMPRASFQIDSAHDAEIEVQLRTSEREGNFTPDAILATRRVKIALGKNRAAVVDFGVSVPRAQYVFVCVMPCDGVAVHLSDQRVTGVLSLTHGANRKVAKNAVQSPPAGIGVDTFEFWIPMRRPAGQNLAMAFDPPIALFGAENVLDGPTRPATQPNAWVAALHDPKPALTLRWERPQTISRIELFFDTDFDHAMESVQWGHPERAMPFCVKHYRVRDADGALLAECAENHQTRNRIVLPQPVKTDRIVIECISTHGGGTPAALFAVRCYA
jgi:hypothetical protein